jgi:hypothetical protein
MLAVHSYPSRKHTPTQTDNIADNNNKYKVKGILNTCISS